MSFTIPTYGPGTPLYTGTYALERPIPFTVTLDGRDYPVDLREYRHNGIARFREGVVTSGEPNDQLFDSSAAWWRYRFSWHHGAGQDVADLDPDDTDPARFARSRGVDVWEKYEACLLPATTEVLNEAGVDLVATGTHLYVSTGAALQRSSDLSSWTAITGITGTINALTTDGTNVYVATTSGVFTVGAGTVASATSTATPTTGFDNIAFVANRLLVADGNRIGELTPTTLDVVYTHYQAAFRWTAIFQVGSRIYVGGFAGNRSELYSLTTTDTGLLALSAEAASFFSNELLRGALAYGGSVLLFTSRGIRFATVGGDGTLQYGPLIDAPGDVRCAQAEGRFCWFGWEDFPDGGSGLGRLALDDFVDTLQPAYATDVFTDDGAADVVAVARFAGRTVFCVEGLGVYASSTTAFVTEGYLETGDVYFGTIEDKSLTELRTRFTELDAGESVAVEVFGDAGVSIGSSTVTSDGATETTIDLAGDAANVLTARFTLGGDGTSSPCLRQWRARAYPVTPPVAEWLVPLIIRSNVLVSDGPGQGLSLDPWAEIVRLKDAWEEARIVLYREGDHAFRVRIDNFQVGAIRWTDGSEWFETTVTVRLLSA